MDADVLFDVTLIVVVAAHLLAVNLASAGPLVAAWIEWCGSRRHDLKTQLAAKTLARCSVWAAAIGVGLGLAVLAAALHFSSTWLSSLSTGLKSVPAGRRWFVAAEIAFYFVCMAAYIWLWRPMRRWPWAHRFLAIAAATNFLYHFPALFTIIDVAAGRPETRGLPLDVSLYRRLLVDPETLARVTHVCLASFAVSGLAACWIGELTVAGLFEAGVGDSDDRGHKPRLQELAGRWALAATLLQVPVGVWVLLSLPEPRQERLMGGDPLSTAFLGTSVLGAIALLHQLAVLALGDVSRRRLVVATALMSAVVLLMTAALHVSRG